MKYLLPEYWKNFKRDGKLFEQLSRVLIEYEYNQKDFYIVGGPNDGGKDIYKDITLLENYTTQIWAQCKYYKRTLSFDDISYTLLMAYLKNTNQILIFSYSKASRTLIDTLQEYKVRTGKSVILFMDDSLENLIFKHQSKLYKEHKEFFSSFPDVTYYPESCLTNDYQLYIDGVRITNKNTTINLNTICELVITITNQSFERKDIKLEYIENRIAQSFLFFDMENNKSFTISPQCSIIIKIYVKLKNNIKSTSLPVFKVYCDNLSTDIRTDKKISCRWLADTTLIGRKYYDAVARINDGIRCSHFHLSYVYGKSGVGKSRILSEIREQCIKSDKKYIYIDSEKKELSCKTFIELVCSKMTILPLFKEKVTVLSDTNSIALDYATRILYDDSYDVVKELDKASKFLAYLMTSQKYMLVLDNLQHFDKASLQLIDNLITILKNTQNESNILFGINTDYIYKGSFFNEFFHKLKFSCGNSPKFYLGIQLEGFELCDAELYIRECLTYRSNDVVMTQINYDKAIKKIAVHCNNTPFYIQQYLLYLEQKNILRRSKNTLFYFYNVEDFKKSFQEIPQNIEALIAERERLFVINTTSDSCEKYKNLIYLINLTNYLPLSLFYNIIGDNTLLNYILDLGFITLIDNAIVPIHSYYALYYKSKYIVEGIPSPLLKQFVDAVEQLNCQNDLAFPYLWAKQHLGIVEYSILQIVTDKIFSSNFDCSAFAFCLKSISAVIEQYHIKLGTKKYIKLYRNLCQKLDETLGINESIYYYETFLQSFLNETENYIAHIDTVLHLLTSYLIHLVNVEKYEECMVAIENITLSMKCFSSSDNLKANYQMNRCKIMIYNRNDDVREAINLANENLNILQNEIIDSSFKNKYYYSGQRSIGNTYFYSSIAYNNRKIIIDSWNLSYEEYIKNYGTDISTGFSIQPKVAAFAKGLAADIISENEDAAEIKAKFFENAFDKMNMIYYEMQIRLLIAIYMTWKWSDSTFLKNHISDINQYIDQTLDIAAIYGRQLTTINSFHLRAVMYFLNGDYELSLDNFHITADLLIKYLTSDKDYNRWKYFWLDYARILRKCNFHNNTISTISYCDMKTQTLISEICSMQDKEFKTFEQEYIPLTAITDKQHSINFPKI